MMPPRFLVLGSGLFSKRIATNLNGQVFITLRSVVDKAARRANGLGLDVKGLQMQDAKQLASILVEHGPFIAVINTCGPWNDKKYELAQTTLHSKMNYIDLSDSFDHHGSFVAALDHEASENKVIPITGATTCPAMSMAIT